MKMRITAIVLVACTVGCSSAPVKKAAVTAESSTTNDLAKILKSREADVATIKRLLARGKTQLPPGATKACPEDSPCCCVTGGTYGSCDTVDNCTRLLEGTCASSAPGC